MLVYISGKKKMKYSIAKVSITCTLAFGSCIKFTSLVYD